MGGWSLLGPGVSPCRSASPCTGRECATQGLPWPLSPHPDRAQEPETCQDTRPAKMTLLSNISGTEAPLCRGLCAYRPCWLEAAVGRENQECQLAEGTHQNMATRKIQA